MFDSQWVWTRTDNCQVPGMRQLPQRSQSSLACHLATAWHFATGRVEVIEFSTDGTPADMSKRINKTRIK